MRCIKKRGGNVVFSVGTNLLFLADYGGQVYLSEFLLILDFFVFWTYAVFLA
jgi:hypothetical protein